MGKDLQIDVTQPNGDGITAVLVFGRVLISIPGGDERWIPFDRDPRMSLDEVKRAAWRAVIAELQGS